jgi:hypothetical protein
MPNQSPYGNLTATLVVVALLELVVDRLLGRLFLSPGCQSGLACLLLRTGPFLLHLTGALALVVGAGGIAGHLKRGELFPRGVRLTVAALSLVFMMLVGVSLVLGRMPERYHIHLETSFGFVVALLMLSFFGARAASARMRIGFALFALPTLLHVAALVAARAGWLRQGWMSPDRLTSIGEVTLLLAATTAPVLLLPSGIPRTRIAAGLALAAGVSAFFFVAFLGRADLVQTVALYSVHLELPRALSLLGALYVTGLFGIVTALGVLLLSPGAARLSGLGICLISIAGYETASPVALALSLCGLVALATGLLRSAGAGAGQDARLSAAAWRSLLGTIAAGIADPPVTGADPVLIEVMAGGEPGTEGDSDTASVRAPRRGRPIVLRIRRLQGVVRALDVTVGTPEDAPPDATIESHEVWLGRRPEDRSSLPRIKTGDATFDRKLGVHGRAPLEERALRRRMLSLADGTVTLWGGHAARFVAPAIPTEKLRRFALPAAPSAARSLVDMVDTLVDLVEATQTPTPPEAA